MLDFRKLIQIDYEILERELDRIRPQRVLLEIPRWLRHELDTILEHTRKRSSDVFLLGDDVWGACYFNVDLMRRVNADCIIHFGHGKFCSTDFELVLIPYLFTNWEHLEQLVLECAQQLGTGRKIYVELSLEFRHLTKKIVQTFSDYGIQVERLKANLSSSCLGCRYEPLTRATGKYDAVVFVADEFYGYGSVEAVGTSVFVIEPYLNKVIEYGSQYAQSLRNSRQDLFAKIGLASRIGIIVETHVGQMRLKQAAWYKEELAKKGQAAEILFFSEVTPSKLLTFPSVDIFINTTCPRLSHYGSFEGIPIISEQEALHYINDAAYPSRILFNFPRIEGNKTNFKP
jgi:diphthamide biosynthesis enzyme Dph1/Dph2-like protein